MGTQKRKSRGFAGTSKQHGARAAKLTGSTKDWAAVSKKDSNAGKCDGAAEALAMSARYLGRVEANTDWARTQSARNSNIAAQDAYHSALDTFKRKCVKKGR